MTVYNRGQFLAAAIESVLAQTFEDWELIIVDDASTDRSVEIAREYERADERIQVHVNERNLGDYPNRNRAASLASGEYLKYVDADDVIYPHGLETFVEAIASCPEAGYCLSVAESTRLRKPVRLDPRAAYDAHYLQHAGYFSSGPGTAIIRRDAFQDVGGFRADGRCTADCTLWAALSQRFPVVLTVPGLTWWRKHEQQESAWQKGAWAKVEVAQRMFAVHVEHIDHSDCPLDQTERDQVRYRLQRDHLRMALSYLRRGRVTAARTLLQSPAFNLRHALVPMPTAGRCLKTAIVPQPLNRATRQRLSIAVTPPAAVSVLMAAYNAADHIDEAIESVLAQRLHAWELIIVDDASQDSTAERVRRYGDSRIRLIQSDQHLGKWAARNRAAAESHARLLKFLDADDVLYPNALSLMVRGMQTSGAGIGISIDNIVPPATTLLSPRDVYRHEFRGFPILQQGPQATIYARDAFKWHGGFCPDHEPACRELALKITADRRCLLLPSGLYWLRRNARSRPRIASHFPLGEQEGLPWLTDLLRAEACPLPRNEAQSVVDAMRATLLRAILRQILCGRLVHAAALWRRGGLSLTDLRHIRRRKPWMTADELREPYRIAHTAKLSFSTAPTTASL